MQLSKGKNKYLNTQKTRRTLPLVDGRDVYEELRRFNRDPFTELLAEWLKCAPDIADVQAFASKHPDKYVQALHHLSALAGFYDKREVDVSLTMNVRELSDSQIEDRLIELQKQLDLQAVEIEDAALITDDSESDS